MIVALRVYVVVFAVGLLAPVAILPIIDPRLGCSDEPCPGTAQILATALLVLLVAASALVAAIGVRARGARWLAAVFLSIEVLRYGYFMLPLARASMADALLMIVTASPFRLGPLCVALWLCRRVSTSSLPSGQTEARS
jgi:hypothetical protein